MAGFSLSTAFAAWSTIVTILRCMRFKITGGFSAKVCSLLSGLLGSEEAAKATLSATEWSWQAMGLLAYFQRAISFGIVKMAALSVQNGMRHAQAAATPRPAASDSDYFFRLPLNGAQPGSVFASPSG